MLLEALLLLLVDLAVIRKEQMIQAIDGVVEVKQAIAGTNEHVVVSMASIGLLRAVSTSVLPVALQADPARPERDPGAARDRGEPRGGPGLGGHWREH